MLAPSGILGVIASVAVLAAPASARGPWAGSVDMNAACSEQYANGQGGWWAISLGTSAWDWRCTDQFGARESVDVTRYCCMSYYAPYFMIIREPVELLLRNLASFNPSTLYQTYAD
jgi:hypothetical protein